jgi:hypothetical protein
MRKCSGGNLGEEKITGDNPAPRASRRGLVMDTFGAKGSGNLLSSDVRFARMKLERCDASRQHARSRSDVPTLER